MAHSRKGVSHFFARRLTSALPLWYNVDRFLLYHPQGAENIKPKAYHVTQVKRLDTRLYLGPSKKQRIPTAKGSRIIDDDRHRSEKRRLAREYREMRRHFVTTYASSALRREFQQGASSGSTELAPFGGSR